MLLSYPTQAPNKASRKPSNTSSELLSSPSPAPNEASLEPSHTSSELLSYPTPTPNEASRNPSNTSSGLLSYHTQGLIEAGTDEAGRGCLAGPVYAAAVILPPDYTNNRLNDSKQLTERQRYALREEIIRDALAWAVGVCSAKEIDHLNILRASITAMHRALDTLAIRPQHIIVDGNRFYDYHDPTSGLVIPHHTIVKGDGKYLAIAAASILAKTFRDDEMLRLAADYPQYGWSQNKGYPAKSHRDAIARYGTTEHHRLSFRPLPDAQQLELNF